jgi:hypothetical protein
MSLFCSWLFSFLIPTQHLLNVLIQIGNKKRIKTNYWFVKKIWTIEGPQIAASCWKGTLSKDLQPILRYLNATGRLCDFEDINLDEEKWRRMLRYSGLVCHICCYMKIEEKRKKIRFPSSCTLLMLWTGSCRQTKLLNAKCLFHYNYNVFAYKT